MSHTPTPWTLTSTVKDYYVKGPEGQVVFGNEPYEGWPPDEDTDALFIVRACNAHDELVAALERIGKRAAYTKSDRKGDLQRDLFHISAIVENALAKAGAL